MSAEPTEPTEIDLLPPTSCDGVRRRLRRASVAVTQAETSGAETMPLLRSAKRHLVVAMMQLDELIVRAETCAEGAAAVPSTLEEMLTPWRNDRIVKDR